MGLETIVEWPKEDGIYKVVQFIAHGKPYLRFNTDPDEQYSSIVNRFAREIGERPRIVEFDGVPLLFLPKDKKYSIPGMGRCQLTTSHSRRTAEFYGFSANYIMAEIKGIDPEHLELIKRFASITPQIVYNADRTR